jgi:hypothetical protein
MRLTPVTPSNRSWSALAHPLALVLVGCAAAGVTPTTPSVVTSDVTARPVRADFSFPYDGFTGVSWCAAAERYEPCGEPAADGSERVLGALVAPLLGDTSIDAPMQRSEVEAWVLERRGIARRDYGTAHHSGDEEGVAITDYVHLDALPSGGEALRLVTITCSPEALEADAEGDVDTDDADADACRGCQDTAQTRYVYAADGRLIHLQEFSESCECVDSRFTDTEFQYEAGVLSGVRHVDYVHPTCVEFGEGWDAAQMRYESGSLPAEDHWLECQLTRDPSTRPLELSCRSDLSGTETWGRVVFHYAD